MIDQYADPFEDALQPSSNGEYEFYSKADLEAGKFSQYFNNAEIATWPEAGYQGGMLEMKLFASGPPFLAAWIKEAVKNAIEAHGGTWVQVDVLETTTRQLAGYSVWGNYAVKAYYHGSPFVLETSVIIIIAVIAGLVVLGIAVQAWDHFEVNKAAVALGEQTNERIRIAQPIADALVAQGKPQEAAKVIDNVAKAAATTPPAGATSADGILGNVGNIGKWVVFGLIAFAVIQSIPAITSGVKSLKGSNA